MQSFEVHPRPVDLLDLKKQVTVSIYSGAWQATKSPGVPMVRCQPGFIAAGADSSPEASGESPVCITNGGGHLHLKWWLGLTPLPLSRVFSWGVVAGGKGST